MDKETKDILDNSKLDQLYKNNLFSIKSMSQLVGTWDNYTKDEQWRLENLTPHDSSINGNFTYSGMYEKKLKYGEITQDGTETILEKINKYKKITDKDVFVDIGSGAGKLLIHMSIKSNFKTLVGIEIQKERYEYSKLLKNQFAENNPIFLLNKDVLEFDLSIGSIFFINDIYFSSNLCKNIYDKLPNGTHFITSKNRKECKILKETFDVSVSWSKDKSKFNYYIKYV